MSRIIMMMMKVTKEIITLARNEVHIRRRIRPLPRRRNNRKIIRREAGSRRREAPKQRTLASNPPRARKQLLRMMDSRVRRKVVIRGKNGRKHRHWMVINCKFNRKIWRIITAIMLIRRRMNTWMKTVRSRMSRTTHRNNNTKIIRTNRK